jgi:tRNA(Ile)-lysidine synthase
MSPLDPLPEDRVAARLRACLQSTERRWIVGVSGGADSLFLLHCARRLAPEWEARVHVVHLNHGWRGAESDGDEAFVRSEALRSGVPLRLASYSPQIPAGHNRQDWARMCRRHELLAAAGENGVILLGHQAWDQSETVLAGLLKGKAPWGLRVLRERDGRWIRPMLDLGGSDVRQRCRELGICWREDSSNASDQYERSHLRHTWLAPLRRKAGPEVDRLLGRIAEQLAQAHSEHEENLKELLVNLDLQPNALGWSLERAAFLPYHKALSPDLLRLLGHRLGFWSRDPARACLENWSRQIANGRCGSRVSLSSGRCLELGRERAWVVLGPDVPQLRLLRPGDAIQLPGVRVFWREGASREDESWQPAPGDEARTVVMRHWLPGDRLRISPQGRKRVVELMTERGYAPVQKRRQLVLLVDGEIRWCPGLGRAWPPTTPGALGPQPIWVRTCASP